MSGLKRQIQQLHADVNAITGDDDGAPYDPAQMTDDELIGAIRLYVRSSDPAARRAFAAQLQADGATPDELREFSLGERRGL